MYKVGPTSKTLTSRLGLNSNLIQGSQFYFPRWSRHVSHQAHVLVLRRSYVCIDEGALTHFHHRQMNSRKQLIDHTTQARSADLSQATFPPVLSTASPYSCVSGVEAALLGVVILMPHRCLSQVDGCTLHDTCSWEVVILPTILGSLGIFQSSVNVKGGLQLPSPSFTMK